MRLAWLGVVCFGTALACECGTRCDNAFVDADKRDEALVDDACAAAQMCIGAPGGGETR